eukprot:GHVR01086343.1.p1 GENE.GHVR01086343.1~~GHVR01086343.1.p1  ORF type:complete len:692 (+),score=104.69 GHVR01086343.1:75-2150(+)
MNYISRSKQPCLGKLVLLVIAVVVLTASAGGLSHPTTEYTQYTEIDEIPQYPIEDAYTFTSLSEAINNPSPSVSDKRKLSPESAECTDFMSTVKDRYLSKGGCPSDPIKASVDVLVKHLGTLPSECDTENHTLKIGCNFNSCMDKSTNIPQKDEMKQLLSKHKVMDNDKNNKKDLNNLFFLDYYYSFGAFFSFSLEYNENYKRTWINVGLSERVKHMHTETKNNEKAVLALMTALKLLINDTNPTILTERVTPILDFLSKQIEIETKSSDNIRKGNPKPITRDTVWSVDFSRDIFNNADGVFKGLNGVYMTTDAISMLELIMKTNNDVLNDIIIISAIREYYWYTLDFTNKLGKYLKNEEMMVVAENLIGVVNREQYCIEELPYLYMSSYEEDNKAAIEARIESFKMYSTRKTKLNYDPIYHSPMFHPPIELHKLISTSNFFTNRIKNIYDHGEFLLHYLKWMDPKREGKYIYKPNRILVDRVFSRRVDILWRIYDNVMPSSLLMSCLYHEIPSSKDDLQGIARSLASPVNFIGESSRIALYSDSLYSDKECFSELYIEHYLSNDIFNNIKQNVGNTYRNKTYEINRVTYITLYRILDDINIALDKIAKDDDKEKFMRLFYDEYVKWHAPELEDDEKKRYIELLEVPPDTRVKATLGFDPLGFFNKYFKCDRVDRESRRLVHCGDDMVNDY